LVSFCKKSALVTQIKKLEKQAFRKIRNATDTDICMNKIEKAKKAASNKGKVMPKVGDDFESHLKKQCLKATFNDNEIESFTSLKKTFDSPKNPEV